jgi:hypothetical protein
MEEGLNVEHIHGVHLNRCKMWVMSEIERCYKEY